MLPDLVLNRTGVNTNSGDQELEAANVLLSLGDSLESTLDDADDNADLMPIGGVGTVPIDIAPQPLRLDQVSVDAAIAGIVQSEEPTAELDGDKGDAQTTKTPQDADPEDDIPLATLAKTLEKPKSPAKGILKTKTYGLKKKLDSKRTFKCPVCDTWKSSVQRLNAHYTPPDVWHIWSYLYLAIKSVTTHV